MLMVFIIGLSVAGYIANMILQENAKREFQIKGNDDIVKLSQSFNRMRRSPERFSPTSLCRSNQRLMVISAKAIHLGWKKLIGASFAH